MGSVTGSQLSGDFYNLTNRANVYSNPDTTATMTIRFGNCVPWATHPRRTRVRVRWARVARRFTVCGIGAWRPAGYRRINQVAPGSTPFAFQAGAKFIF